MRGTFATAALALLVGCGSSGIEGKLVDGMTGEPIGEMRLVAQAVDQVGMTCQTAQGTTDAQGQFKIDGACISESAYKLEADDKNLWFADLPEVAKGQAGPVEVKAWRAGEGSGVFELAGKELSRVGTGSDFKPRKIYMSDEEVLRPKQVPGELPIIEEGEYLVISGTSNVDDMAFHPLLPSGPRKFGNDEEWVDAEAWWYVGTDFKSDTEFDRVEATVDDSKILVKEGAERKVKYVPHDALPPGRYVLMKEGDKRAIMVDFVKAPELPAATDGEAEAPAPE